MNDTPSNEGQAPERGDGGPLTGGEPPVDPQRVLTTALEVIRAPSAFYRGMPRAGGFVEPLLFLVAMALVATVASLLLRFAGLGVGGVITGGLVAVILVPIAAAIVAFVAGAVFYGIWKLMGSGESYETAFRCVAYSAATAPVTAVLDLLPYAGTLVAVLWPMALLAIASVEVHGRRPQAAWLVFGVLGVALAWVNLSAERTSRGPGAEFGDRQDLRGCCRRPSVSAQALSSRNSRNQRAMPSW